LRRLARRVSDEEGEMKGPVQTLSVPPPLTDGVPGKQPIDH